MFILSNLHKLKKRAQTIAIRCPGSPQAIILYGISAPKKAQYSQ